ncbi:MAG: hypothetical protein V4475_07640 [Pseudomonadota bacterium]
MSVGRWCAVVSCLCLASPLAAQSAALPRPAPAQGQISGPDVVVNALVDKRKGSWKRADSEHVVVISKDSAGELTRITRNLERLYQLMSRFYRRGASSDDTVKLQVVLIDKGAAFRAMELRNLRAAEGPYLPAFPDQTHYDPREDGELLAMARSDEVIDLNTNRAFNQDCDKAEEEGATDCVGQTVNRFPVARSWEELLYAAFAQRFVQTYDPAAYPRWYLDGVGALFSTIALKGDGSIEYARPPLGYRDVFYSYGDLKVGDILAGRYLDAEPGKRAWTPYHAWLLAHYFLFSDLKPERARQFHDYMTAIHRGAPMAEAARVFGDMNKLQRELATYAVSAKSFARSAPTQAPAAEPAIATLSPGGAAMVEARIALGSRIAPLPADATASEVQRRANWLAQVREAVARLPDDGDALVFAAEAECRSGHAGECLVDADRALARSPNDIAALSWRGVALTDQAVAGPPAERANRLALARTAIEHAIALDGAAPLPLIAWFQSFTKAGERVPDAAMLGMAKVIRAVPAAPAPRLYLAEELLRQGKGDVAQRVAHMVLHGPYDSPEKTAAAALFATTAATPAAGR